MPEIKYITIPAVAIELIRAVGFIKRYRELCQECRSFAKAYEATEAEYEQYFGMRRYADYYSFKASLHYHSTRQRARRKTAETPKPSLLFELDAIQNHKHPEGDAEKGDGE